MLIFGISNNFLKKIKAAISAAFIKLISLKDDYSIIIFLVIE